MILLYPGDNKTHLENRYRQDLAFSGENKDHVNIFSPSFEDEDVSFILLKGVGPFFRRRLLGSDLYVADMSKFGVRSIYAAITEFPNPKTQIDVRMRDWRIMCVPTSNLIEDAH